MDRKKITSHRFFVPGFLIVFGVVLILLAAARVVQTESFLERADQTTGTILETQQGVLIKNARITVEFLDAAGTAIKTQFETGGETTTHKVGDSVTLFYDPMDTSSVYVGNPRLRRYTVAGIYLFLGGCLIVFTLRRLRQGNPWV